MDENFTSALSVNNVTSWQPCSDMTFERPDSNVKVERKEKWNVMGRKINSHTPTSYPFIFDQSFLWEFNEAE